MAPRCLSALVALLARAAADGSASGQLRGPEAASSSRAAAGRSFSNQRLGHAAVSKLPQPSLPSVPHSLAGGAGTWWVCDGYRVYYPPALDTGLSQNISDYFYLQAADEDLPDGFAQHRVGGSRGMHIFHFPGYSPILQGQEASKLVRLTAGVTVAAIREWTVSAGYEDPLDSDGLAAEARLVAAVSTQDYQQYLDTLTQAGVGSLGVSTRSTANTEATTQTAQWLHQEFQSLGATACMQRFDVQKIGSHSYNVMAFFQGAEAGTVTIGAHFDVLPINAEVAPGAEDNGSGTAGVLTALKAFISAGISLRKSVYFVAFGAEEQGLIGSQRFVAELRNPGGTSSPIPEECRPSVTDTAGHSGLTMDMIGWQNTAKFSTPTVLTETKAEYAEWFNDPLATSISRNLAPGSLTLLHSNFPFGSDHMSFMNAGLPATLLIDNDGDVYQFACYHRSCDVPANIDAQYATNIVRMNLGAMLRIQVAAYEGASWKGSALLPLGLLCLMQVLGGAPLAPRGGSWF